MIILEMEICSFLILENCTSHFWGYNFQITEMPLSLFGNKFSPKKTPPRRAHSLSNLHLDATQSREEFGPDVGPVKLKLGGSEIQFDNGMWIAGNVDFSILLLPL